MLRTTRRDFLLDVLFRCAVVVVVVVTVAIWTVCWMWRGAVIEECVAVHLTRRRHCDRSAHKACTQYCTDCVTYLQPCRACYDYVIKHYKSVNSIGYITAPAETHNLSLAHSPHVHNFIVTWEEGGKLPYRPLYKLYLCCNVDMWVAGWWPMGIFHPLPHPLQSK